MYILVVFGMASRLKSSNLILIYKIDNIDWQKVLVNLKHKLPFAVRE